MQRNLFYQEQMQDVLDFNAESLGGFHNYSEKAVQRQWDLVNEEYNEILEAVADGDEVEVAKEMADFFIVCSYLVHLYEVYYEGISEYLLPFIEYNINGTVEGEEFTLEKMLTTLGNSIAVEDPTAALDDWAAIALTLNFDMAQVIDAKMESNWSKLPPLSDFPTMEHLELECIRIEQSSAGRYSDVTFDITPGNRVAFRCDYGHGKVVKPAQYFEAAV